MNKKKREKQLQIVVFVLIAIITLGIGYTAISSIILTITGHARADVDEANFKVHFDRNVEPTMTVNMGSATIDQDNDKVAHISVTGLKKAGDSATAEYTIINESNGIGAKLSIDLVNTNTEHFKVTETLDDVELEAGDTTKVRILVELLETPTDTALETDITGTIEAKAIKNSEANSNDSATKTKPGTFGGDSWETIASNVRNNNTSAYKVGDTKTVTINGNDYTVRIANKSTPEECNNENFSQTACGFVVEFVDIVDYVNMNGTYTNSGGYPASRVYTFLRDTLYSQLSNDLQEVIIPTKVISANENGNDIGYETIDRIYILSIKELFDTNISDAAALYTRQLDYYKSKNVSYFGSDLNSYGSPSYFNNSVFVQKNGKPSCDNFRCDAWWTRTPNSTNCFISVCGYDNFVTTSGTAPSKYGVAPAFRIG